MGQVLANEKLATIPLVKTIIQQGTSTNCIQCFVQQCTCDLHVRTRQTSSLSSIAGNLESGEEITLTVRVGNPSASTDATSARSARSMLLDQR